MTASVVGTDRGKAKLMAVVVAAVQACLDDETAIETSRRAGTARAWKRAVLQARPFVGSRSGIPWKGRD